MESSEELKPVKRQPFDFGIRKFKNQLRESGMSKSHVNEAVRLYKKKVYDKVAEVKAKMEAEFKEKNDASEKQGTALHMGRQSGVPKASKKQEQANKSATA